MYIVKSVCSASFVPDIIVSMKLYLTRHGETQENKLGILQGHLPGKLSVEGIEQARALAKRLEHEHLDIIYSSDLMRVVDTSREITVYHPDTPIIFTEKLRERHLGEFQGKNRHDLGIKNIASLETKEGEALVDFFARAKSFLVFLIEKHPRDNVLLVCHGGIGKAIIASILNKSALEFAEMEGLDNTSLSIFEIASDGSYQELCYNSTDHLRNS
jgi:broad specificity phosphatase PhoE